MAKLTQKTTVYLAPQVRRALRNKATRTKKSLSALINDAVNLHLQEDAEDMAAFDLRKHEPNLDFAAFVKGLKRRGAL